MKIGIIGSGVVGYAVGKGFDQLKHDVLFYDINKSRAEAIIGEGRRATTDIKSAAEYSDVFFVCVPTPTKKRKIDLSIITAAAKDLAKAARNKKGYFLIAVKSTVVPTTTEKLIIPLFEKYSGKKAGADFGVCYNPEFLRAKYAFEDFMDPDRIVIGEYDKKSGDILGELYAPFTCPVIRTPNFRTAELIKYANNCFYAAKISFFNEIHLISEKLGIDSALVRRAVQMDRYYPSHPLFHGKGFGGECLPKDLNALIGFCAGLKIHNPVLLKSVWAVNKLMMARGE